MHSLPKWKASKKPTKKVGNKHESTWPQHWATVCLFMQMNNASRLKFIPQSRQFPAERVPLLRE